MASRFVRDLLTSLIPELRRKIGVNNKTIKSLSSTAKLEVNGLKSVNTFQDGQRIKLKIGSTHSSKRTLIFVSRKFYPFKKVWTNPKL